MPLVLDNIDLKLLDSLRAVLSEAFRADFCVGYFNLRGWRKIASIVDGFPGGNQRLARVLVGMTEAPEEELAQAHSVLGPPPSDPRAMKQRETKMAEAFRVQLSIGLPDGASVAGLRHLAQQLRDGKVEVRLFVKHRLHAKLYLAERADKITPLIGYVGSSNLTAPGLSEQGELNLQETDPDVTRKLSHWFEDRWEDAVDITAELIRIIEESWAAPQPFSPYEIYMKIVHSLAFEALEAPMQYQLPQEFENVVLDFQKDAILRVRHILRDDPAQPEHHRIAVLGDVVGMGKTLTATAVAKCYQADRGGRCIVCCPVKLQKMWQDQLRQYEIAGEVVPYSQVKKLAEQKGRTRLLILDESHNLRNRETKAWAAIRQFIRDQDARVLLLSATPYNKHYEDLASQLALALDDAADLGVRPENYFITHDEMTFQADFQASPRSLRAFQQSASPDDWRDLLRHFLVRRTRGFIIKHHAHRDGTGRPYLLLAGDVKSYFPKRVPKTLAFPLDLKNPNDQYARLFNETVVSVIEHLHLPRYGLGEYAIPAEMASAPKDDKELLENLGQAGKSLLGYSRSNLFKRLESSGAAFLLSLERHIVRNLVYLHALDRGLDLPIGTQDSSMLDPSTSDADSDSDAQMSALDVTTEQDEPEEDTPDGVPTWKELEARAAAAYAAYAKKKTSRKFKWINCRYFRPALRKNLMADAQALYKVLCDVGAWKPEEDAKTAKVFELLTTTEKNNKVLIFSQFADTAHYLADELQRRGLTHVESVSASSSNPADQVRRFSPKSNHSEVHAGEQAIRVLVATEVLSEGQNCQDASIVINYDLPWAIIRLIQRAGRVDRIAQESAEIRIYSCLPAEGVEKLIDLRGRLRRRLKENGEVIGTDEQFFEDEEAAKKDMAGYYAKKLQEEEAETDDVDISSKALALWEEAKATDPDIEKKIRRLPDQVFTCKPPVTAPCAAVYVRTAEGYDSLMKVDTTGNVVSQSVFGILNEIKCPPDEKGLATPDFHHDLVKSAVETAVRESTTGENALGSRNSIRRRVYERLRDYRNEVKRRKDLFRDTELARLDEVINELQKYQLDEIAKQILSRSLKEGVRDQQLADLSADLREQARLSYITEEQANREPELICSIGLYPPATPKTGTLA